MANNKSWSVCHLQTDFDYLTMVRNPKDYNKMGVFVIVFENPYF